MLHFTLYIYDVVMVISWGLLDKIREIRFFNGGIIGLMGLLQRTYSWVGENMDIVESSINSTYDYDNMKNSILKIYLFHSPSPQLTRNGNGTMVNIDE